MTAGLLLRVPTEDDQARLYHELAQLGAPSVGEPRPWPYSPQSPEELLGLATEMLRYDPRLLSILVQWLRARYQTLNPLHLRSLMRNLRYPQAMLVVFSFARLDGADAELSHFADYLAAGQKRVEPAERFFLDVERPGSRRAARNLGRNLAPYARWGFIGQERPTIDAISKRALGRYDARTRAQILRELLTREPEITLATYLEAVDHSITRQQALTDLKKQARAVKGTRGPSARWRKLERRASRES